MRSFLLFFYACTAVWCTSCSAVHHEHEEGGRFPATHPVVVDTSLVEEYVCQIRSMQHIELRALERGYLQHIYVDEGQYVREGQPMFQIMPLLYQAEMQRAAAEASFAEIEYLNTKSLADSNVVAPNELALAKAKFDKANAELALARVHLGFTEIKAPFNGIMDRFHVRLGSLVEEGELLTELSDNSRMWVYFNVPEAQYLDYMSDTARSNRMQVRLRMANGKLFERPGVVETIEADFNNETGNIAFRAAFDNPKGLLRHGETGSILIEVPLKNALLIPQKATYEVLDKRYVYVIDDTGTVRARMIQVAAELPHLYAVSEGLQPSDVVLIEGLRRVRNGEKIEYDLLDGAQVIANLDLYAE